MKKLEKNVIEAAKAELKVVEEVLCTKKKKVSTQSISWLLEDVYFKYEIINNSVDIIKNLKTLVIILMFGTPSIWWIVQKYPEIENMITAK